MSGVWPDRLPPSRVGVESRAERHEQKTDHAVGIDAMEAA